MKGVYNNLCDKLKSLFDDETNWNKYFDNLVNILEILDYAWTHYEGFGHSCFSLLFNKFKSDDKISKFINLVKNFEATDNEYMFVVKDANGTEIKTPGLQITTAQILFDSGEIIIASDINNTCATGMDIQDQFKTLHIDSYVNDNADHNNKLSRDIFDQKSGSREFLLALKKIKDHYEWENQITQDYFLQLRDLNYLIG